MAVDLIDSSSSHDVVKIEKLLAGKHSKSPDQSFSIFTTS